MAAAPDEGLNRPGHRSKPKNTELQAVKSKAKSNRVHDSIYVMLQQNPDPESGIQQAVTLLTKSNEDLFRITKKIDEKQNEERVAYNKLYSLEYEERGFRSKSSIVGKRMAALKRELDKLTFANNAYKDRSISTQDKLNLHNLHFHMHHGTYNMAKEKKLLEEVNACKKKSNDDFENILFLLEQIRRLKMDIGRNYFIPRPAIMVDEKQVLQEINELKWKRDKAFADAPVKGKIWNSLPPKNVIKKQIKEMELVLDDEYRKKHMELKGEIQAVNRQINGVKRQINGVNKNIASLNRQLLEVRRKKGTAYKEVLRLIKIQNQHEPIELGG
ncbi:uncharacterized protein LOC120115173 [Hibiscus syriacus]|uniref:uncharacterized protein LOC120115173 n=1 Tax=Hibiscus syriacus TaxID=106335 RepID=UPI001920F4F7|nr:uncharacterized protein LOC120115173 [Hibiscus syriacus]